MSWHNGYFCHWINGDRVTCVAFESSIHSRFFSFPYRCAFHFLFHQMTLLCDCGLMGKFSWVWVFFSYWKYLRRFISETIPHFSVAERKHGKPSENGEIVSPLFCEYFTGNKDLKRVKLPQFSTLECNLLRFCFGSDSLLEGGKQGYVNPSIRQNFCWNPKPQPHLETEEKHRAPDSVFTQTQPNIIMLFSRPIRNKIRANVELASTRFPALGTDCMFSLRGLIGLSFNLRFAAIGSLVFIGWTLKVRESVHSQHFVSLGG